MTQPNYTAPPPSQNPGYQMGLTSDQLVGLLAQQLLNAKPSELTFPDGSRYKGEVQNGKPHGVGALTWPNGDVYTGTFGADGKISNGKLIHPDGGYAEGEFHNGQLWNGYHRYAGGSGWQYQNGQNVGYCGCTIV